MKYLMIVLIFLCATASADCEKEFTTEQWSVIITAYEMGKPHDLGLTMAAICWHESFVGDFVVRMSPRDGTKGSYGVCHMQLTTAQSLLNVKDNWKAMAELAPYMIRDDSFALKLSLLYIQQLKGQTKSWRTLLEAYNGGPAGTGTTATGIYADRVATKVMTLKQCLEI